MPVSKLMLAAIALPLLAGIPVALADSDTSGSGWMGMLRAMGMRDDDCPMHGGGMMGGMMDPGKMTERSDARLGELKSELAITPAQEAVWTAYADAIKARVASMAAMHPGMSAMMSGGTAKERLAVRITAMEGMLDTLKQVQPATDALYGALSADQQKRADKVLGAGCGMM